MITLLILRRGQYSFVKGKISEGGQAFDIPIKDLGLSENGVIIAIIGKVMYRNRVGLTCSKQVMKSWP
jgi:hypothetical protein